MLSDLENVNCHENRNSSFKTKFHNSEDFIESMNQIALPCDKKYSKNTVNGAQSDKSIVIENQSLQELNDLLEDLNLAKKELNIKPDSIIDIKSDTKYEGKQSE